MTGNKLSMSRLWLAYKCGYFARPDVEYAEQPSGKKARIGSLLHSLQECKINQIEKSFDDADPEELEHAKALMAGPYGAWLDKHEWDICEVGYRYDAETDSTTVGPRRGEPGYDEHGPMVLKGTLDLLKKRTGSRCGSGEEHSLDVCDTKTGEPRNAHVDQLYAQAVAAARFYRVNEVNVWFVFPRKTKVLEPFIERMDVNQLDYEAGRIRRLLRSIPTAQPTPGDHCFRCPARLACPEHKRDEYIEPDAPEPAIYDGDARLF